eukprot:2666349-Amphidinium_carterae.2
MREDERPSADTSWGERVSSSVGTPEPDVDARLSCPIYVQRCTFINSHAYSCMLEALEKAAVASGLQACQTMVQTLGTPLCTCKVNTSPIGFPSWEQT